MFIPRLNGDDIKSSKYYNRPYSTGDMPNCTTYSLFRACELLDRQIVQNLGGSRISDPVFPYDGYRNACNFYKDWQWAKGQEPKLGAIACWSGTYKSNGQACAGHVAVVEEIYSDGSFLTSNSNYKGTWFYLNKIGADKYLDSKVYNFKFEGFCYIPINVVERDQTKHQVEVKVNGLRLRTGHSTNDDVLAIIPKGTLFNVSNVYNSDYRWLKVDDGWIATKAEWVDEYFPLIDDDLEKQIDVLNAELKEANKVISTMKDMNNSLDAELKKAREKLDKIGGILNE